MRILVSGSPVLSTVSPIEIQQLKAEIASLKEQIRQLQPAAHPVVPVPVPAPVVVETTPPARPRPAAKTPLFDPMWSALHNR